MNQIQNWDLKEINFKKIQILITVECKMMFVQTFDLIGPCVKMEIGYIQTFTYKLQSLK